MGIIVISTAFNEMRFHENDFPRKAFNKMLFKKFRKIMIGEKQGSLGNSFFLLGVIAWEQLLDISADWVKNY